MMNMQTGGTTLAALARRLWAHIVWGAMVSTWCRLRVDGIESVPDEPVVIAANHSSHADTVLLQYLLAKHHRPLVLVAGAEDYWFRNRALGRISAMLGVFAFPRRGDAGVRRARKALRSRATVIIYPQGTRSGGSFRPGVGRIAFGEPTKVVPVRISGSDQVLAKGSCWPRRCDVEVSFGRPTSISLSESPEEFAIRLGNSVLTEAERRVA